MRHLTPVEERRLAVLTANTASVGLLEVTQTGLEKSILDATTPLRRVLAEAGIHDYATQGQGQDNKHVTRAVVHGATAAKETKASLYRPETKKGDPRIWVYGLKEDARPGDIIAIIPHHDALHVANLTLLAIDEFSSQQGHSLQRLLASILGDSSAVSNELLDKLRGIARSGPAPSVTATRSDTSIGRTLEALLGISMNSSKEPDYKGIELKSARRKPGSRQNRKQLFAQVPDWSISKFKSSAEILDAFGYMRDGVFKLNCTVSAAVVNSQGLAFRFDPESDRLKEYSDQPAIGDFAEWQLDVLRSRLREKHAETFWVTADSIDISGHEHFQFRKVLHTRRPILAQFEMLLEQGTITMDHQCKRLPNGQTKERGPAFKIAPEALGLLFPPPLEYSLMAA